MALTLKYDFATDKSLTAAVGPTLTCTRTGNATYFDSSGVMQTAGTDTARFDHDPSDNSSLGLLVEEARTNECLYSESFDSWTGTIGATIDADVATAPDGTLTADRLNPNVGGTTHNVYLTASWYITGETFTHSVYMKDDGAGFGSIAFSSGGSENHITVTANLTTGVITDTHLGTTSGTIVATGIEDAGNGWFRVWIAGSKASTGGYFQISPCESGTPTYDAGGRASYSSTAGKDILLWGAQAEEASFVTSYIPNLTTGTTTRNADVVKTTDVSWYNATEGTAYVDVTLSAVITNDVYYEISDGSSSDRFLSYTFGSSARGYVEAAAAGEGLLTQGTITANTRFRTVLGVQDSDMEFYLDGSRTGTGDQTVSMPAGINKFNVGGFYNDNVAGAKHITEFRYYDTRLTDAELEDMSNGTFPAEGGGNFYIATTRRTASQMRPKQRLQKPKRGLFR